MRRGLMSWSRTELPELILDARVRKAQAGMAHDGLSLLLVYTSFATPAAAHWLCNFTPYWSEGMLAVRPTGMPVLLASMTPRVHPWMREVSHVELVLSAPKLGVATASYIQETTQAQDRIGFVALDEIPCSVMRPIISTIGSERQIVDASALIDRVRHPSDESETNLARQAAHIARAALRDMPNGPDKASQVTSRIERHARMVGAEEVLLRLAPDLERSTVLQRVEGELMLGERFAVEISIAYKGVWIRIVESFARQTRPLSWTEAHRAFEAVLAQGGHDMAQANLPGMLRHWYYERAASLQPLAVVLAAGSEQAPEDVARSRGVLAVELALPDGPWLAAGPVFPVIEAA